MEKEELLRPRYMVIADYPNRPLTMPIGHILTLNKFGASKWWHEYTDAEPLHLEENTSRCYPAILQQLKWYEEREPNEMPLFIKNKSAIPVTFTKVDYWKQIERKDLGSYVQLVMVVDGEEKGVNFWAIEPATEEEYLSNLTQLESTATLNKC